jgi:hypothetical protein
MNRKYFVADAVLWGAAIVASAIARASLPFGRALAGVGRGRCARNLA